MEVRRSLPDFLAGLKADGVDACSASAAVVSEDRRWRLLRRVSAPAGVITAGESGGCELVSN